jgi:hypothetical protein
VVLPAIAFDAKQYEPTYVVDPFIARTSPADQRLSRTAAVLLLGSSKLMLLRLLTQTLSCA